jgi:hypothetical protein
MACQHEGECFGACSTHKSPESFARPMHEHDKIKSRTTGRMKEIGMGPHNGLVPANPFASIAQAGYMHSHPEILGKKGLSEWDSATKGKKLPKKVKK